MGFFSKKTKEEKAQLKEEKAELKGELKAQQKADKAKYQDLVKEHGEFILVPILPPMIFDSKNLEGSIKDAARPQIHIMKSGITYIFKEKGLKTTYDFTEYKLVGVDWEEDLKVKVKKGHPIGRALVGGALFGGAGAVVGAMTTKEDKTVVKKDKSELVLNFQEVETGKMRSIKFKCDTDTYKKWQKFPIQPVSAVE